MILKAVSSKGIIVEKSFEENHYASITEFENAVRIFISTWDKAGDPLSRVWKEEV